MESPRLRVRDLFLWIAIATLGVALYFERAKVSLTAQSVEDSSQAEARASESFIADRALQVESRAKEVERHARDEVEILSRRGSETKKGGR